MKPARSHEAMASSAWTCRRSKCHVVIPLSRETGIGWHDISSDVQDDGKVLCPLACQNICPDIETVY
jgi:hypothetical protein